LELPIFDKKIDILKSFTSQNNNIESGEIIIDEFSCALQKKTAVLIQGKIYISSEAIYFHSYFIDSLKQMMERKGTKFRILIIDIKDITKAKNAIIFDNSIEIKLMND
jgi:hypothetical protein